MPASFGDGGSPRDEVEAPLARLQEVATILDMDRDPRIRQRQLVGIRVDDVVHLEHVLRDVDDLDRLELARVGEGLRGAADAVAYEQGVAEVRVHRHWPVDKELHVAQRREVGA
jgi:hypothetical protein